MKVTCGTPPAAQYAVRRPRRKRVSPAAVPLVARQFYTGSMFLRYRRYSPVSSAIFAAISICSADTAS